MEARYAFELSGEHPTIPRSEALSLLEITSVGYRVVSSLGRALVVDARELDLSLLGGRMAMIHQVVEVSAEGDPTASGAAEAAKSLDLPMKSYRVRATRLGDPPLASDEVERLVGSALWKRGYEADLSDPEIEIRAIVTADRIYLGREVARADRAGFRARRPHLKPFFYPGTMLPKIARALVNLSCAREGELLLDPFAGTGGFLVEAGMMAVRGVGVDVQGRIVRGALTNLEGLDCNLIVGDAMSLPLKDGSIDAAVSDAPYGRSALIQAGSRDELLAGSLAELRRVLIPGGRMIFVDDRPVGEFLEDAGFNIIEVHKERVHRSLTREISVCR
ncbi:methyltransferase domain-containing protein [Candidatus Methanocrinis natronophilus]|uniref:Methyltransferase domain-containing protein n=1 Tax=Candidatus Methanocrinis natronophilus TaxID=3033396 RepID=A0ABT5X9Z7_9EURY|nr:THUMP domain-containing protein [Candidatus Methanocrinis natronophilus]MDF0591534.1 methyltransferase domain-containing protein [Candidatus Methanocrinis natronophilus]